MGERLCNSDFSFLLMWLASSIKDPSKLPKSLWVCGQCLDRVMLYLNPFDFNDFSLKLAKYFKFLNSHFVQKSKIELPQKTQLVAFAAPVCQVLCITWLLSIKSLIKIL